MLTATDTQRISQVAEESGHSAKMTLHGIEHARLNLAEAIKVFDAIHRDTIGKTSEILLKLLPLLRNAEDARVLLHHVTNGDRAQLAQIKQAFGCLFKPLCGVYDGHYSLSLSTECARGRLCLRLLMEGMWVLGEVAYEYTVFFGFVSSNVVGFV